MTKEMKRPISNITQDSIKPLLRNAVEFYTNKNKEAHKCIQERDEYINYLESKLSNAKPQQPEIPEVVADWYEENKNNLEYGIYSIHVDISDTSGEEMSDIENWFNSKAVKPIETIFAMKRLGYTVAKEKRFYLKSKLTGGYIEQSCYHGTIESHDWHDRTAFTQQEIDSVEIGSYEQIEVKE